MNASRKQLKIFLVSEFKKLRLVFLASKLDEFSHFDNFFLNLANFWDLDNFWVFDFWAFNFSDFLAYSILLLLIPISLSLSPTFSLSKADLLDSTVVFSNKVSRTTFLLKP